MHVARTPPHRHNLDPFETNDPLPSKRPFWPGPQASSLREREREGILQESEMKLKSVTRTNHKTFYKKSVQIQKQ